MRKIWFGAVVGCLLLNAGPCPKPKSAPDTCSSTCYTYRQAVIAERDKHQGEVYISPIVATTQPDYVVAHAVVVDRHSYPAIDDRIWFTLNGQQTWEAKYPTKNGEGYIRLRDLKPGSNKIQIWYENTQGPDANFSFRLGGRAFCGDASDCKDFDEGATYGSGLLQKVVPQGYGKGEVAPSNQIYRSIQEAPPASCNCVDP